MREIFNSVNFVLYGIGGIFVNLISMAFNDYRFYLWLNFISLFLSLFGYLYFVETPFFFYQKKDVNNLFSSLKCIIEQNHEIHEVPEITEKLKRKLLGKDEESNKIEDNGEGKQENARLLENEETLETE